ncbi:hypothetical protein JHD46_01500 [Sulfurimonas sp. SAG-AH-194-C20]|nr:outer membrane protein OmpK [Sulfurimonas sp. SAG-AH-194-C20]MDF1878308.1 hypothetical protein [Sulfurimonas sp. SAG-AH-194-C20]
MPYFSWAQTGYSFINLGANYSSWINEAANDDFVFLSAEYGAGLNTAEYYGNVNIHNPTKEYKATPQKNLRYTMVNDLDIKINEAFRVHYQDYHLLSNSLRVNDYVLGLAYKYTNQNIFWFKPFIGIHYSDDSYFTGLNGYMTGWLLNYNFKLLNHNFSIFQWNEIEFLRTKSFYELSTGTPIGDSKSYGLNGAIKLFWHPAKKIKTGIEYRYSKYKRGSDKWLSSFVYTVKYYF